MIKNRVLQCISLIVFAVALLLPGSAQANSLTYYEIKSSPEIIRHNDGNGLVEVKVGIETIELTGQWPFTRKTSTGVHSFSFVYKSVQSPEIKLGTKEVSFYHPVGKIDELKYSGEYELIKIDSVAPGKDWGERNEITYSDYNIKKSSLNSNKLLLNEKGDGAYFFEKRDGKYSVFPNISRDNTIENFSPVEAVNTHQLWIAFDKSIRTSVNLSNVTPLTVSVKAYPAAGGGTDQENIGSGSSSSPSSTNVSGSLPEPIAVFSNLSTSLSDDDFFVVKGWQAVRSIINVFIILILIGISFNNIFRTNIDGYEFKKILPNLIIGIILANASFLILKFLIDINAAATYLIINLTDQVTNDGTMTTLISFVQKVIDTITTGGIDVLFPGTSDSAIGALVKVLLGILSLIGIIWLTLIFYLRLIYLYALIIVAPAALLLYGVPQLNKYFKQWLQLTIKWLFMLPAIVAGFALIILVISFSNGAGNLAALIIVYVLFFNVLKIPHNMGGGIVGNVTNKFKAWTGINAAQGAIKKTWGNEVSYRKKQMGAAWGATGAGRYFAGFGAKRAMQNAYLDKKMAISKARVDTKLESTKQAQKGRMLEWRKKEFENLLKIEKDKFEQENLVTDNKKIKKLRLRMVASDANAEAYSKTVEKLLSKEKGNYATDRFRALEQIFLKADRDKNLAEWQDELRELQKLSADLQSNDTTVYGDAIDKLSTLGINTLEELDEKIVEMQYKTSKKYEDKLKAIFDELKVNYGDIKDSNLDDAVKTAQTDKVRKSIWENESKRHKSVMADRDIAMTKDDIEDGNVSSIASSLRDVFKDLGVDIKEELAKGVTHGLNSKQQTEFVQATHAIRKIAENTRSPHSDKALLEMLRIMKENGRNTVKLMNGQQGKIEDLIKEVESGKIDEKKRRNYMQAVGSDKMFSGSPGNRYEKT